MAVTYKDYYKLLGVERNADASAISSAYKKLARKYHPDLNPGDKQAEEKFKEINEAYEVLKDPEKRKLYDQLGPNWQQGQAFHSQPGFENMHFTFNGRNMDSSGFSGSGFSDFFETLFGGGRGGQHAEFTTDPFGAFSSRNKPKRGRDVEAELSLSLEEVAHGGNRTVTLQTASGPKTLQVNIPAGIRDGKKLRLAGQGDAVAGGTAGDLFLRIHYLPHQLFTVEGDNLNYDLPLAPWEAVLGAKVEVPTLEGSVEMNIPAGVSSGRKFRLRGKGLGDSTNRGDLLVRIMVKVPTEVNAEERTLWQKLAELSTFKARS